MSNRALNWAWEQAGLTHFQKLVFVALADQANDKKDLTCNPGQQFIGRRAGGDARSVRRAIDVLIERGFISRTCRIGIGTTYRVLVPGDENGQLDIPGLNGGGTEDRGVLSRATKRPASEDRGVLSPTRAKPVKRGPESPGVRTGESAEPFLTKEEYSGDRGTSARSLRVVGGTDAADALAHKPMRMPRDWQPTPEDATFARDLGLDPNDVLDEFRDYWLSITGHRGVKAGLDGWSRTWRNRCREVGKRARQARSPQRQSRMDRWRAMMGEQDCGSSDPAPLPRVALGWP